MNNLLIKINNVKGVAVPETAYNNNNLNQLLYIVVNDKGDYLLQEGTLYRKEDLDMLEAYSRYIIVSNEKNLYLDLINEELLTKEDLENLYKNYLFDNEISLSNKDYYYYFDKFLEECEIIKVR